MQDLKVDRITFEESLTIPNNQDLPLLLYRKAIESSENIEEAFRQAFQENNWSGIWVNGIYDYHHYHSNAHEVLGVIEGNAVVALGGPDGKEIELMKGDMVVIPAGVGHKLIESHDHFKVIGAYPKGQENYDICRERDDKEEKKQNIFRVARPKADPMEGVNGPLMEYWK